MMICMAFVKDGHHKSGLIPEEQPQRQQLGKL